MGYIAPAGTPVSLFDLLMGLGVGAVSDKSAADLVNGLRQHSGQQHCWLMSSGRAAMTVIVQSMRDACADPNKNEIIVPAYTCYSVPAAIARAGLKVRLCDIDSRTLSYDMSQLARIDCSRVLGIVTANLYGLPNDLPSIEALARQRGVFMLDDAAQALGARIDGRAVGGFGDVGLYSFDKGKNIATMQGGAIMAREGVLAAAIAKRYAALPATPFGETVSLSIKLVAYSVLLHPFAYGLVRRLPLGLGQTPYEVECLMAQFSPALAGLGKRLFTRLDALTLARRTNAQGLLAALASSSVIDLPQLLPTADPAYARLPVFARDVALRAAMITKLDGTGIGATASYPQALCDVPEARDVVVNAGEPFPAARYVATTIMTLPTHPYCSSDMAKRVSESLNAMSWL